MERNFMNDAYNGVAKVLDHAYPAIVWLALTTLASDFIFS